MSVLQEKRRLRGQPVPCAAHDEFSLLFRHAILFVAITICYRLFVTMTPRLRHLLRRRYVDCQYISYITCHYTLVTASYDNTEEYEHVTVTSMPRLLHATSDGRHAERRVTPRGGAARKALPRAKR